MGEQNRLDIYTRTGDILRGEGSPLASTNKEVAFGEKQFGSSGRIRTYNPSVNSYGIYLLVKCLPGITRVSEGFIYRVGTHAGRIGCAHK